jgi:hypothetical protein
MGSRSTIIFCVCRPDGRGRWLISLASIRAQAKPSIRHQPPGAPDVQACRPAADGACRGEPSLQRLRRRQEISLCIWRLVSRRLGARLHQATAFAPPGILLDLLSKGASGPKARLSVTTLCR